MGIVELRSYIFGGLVVSDGFYRLLRELLLEGESADDLVLWSMCLFTESTRRKGSDGSG